jgi:hypothetical protein
MSINGIKYYFSHRLLFLVMLVYAVNYLFNGAINFYLALIPSLVVDKFEVWRVLSFPLAIPPIESIVLFAFVFYFIAPKIESLLPRTFYPILLGLLVLLQGVISTVTFWKSNIIFTGMDGLSFFIMFLFALLSISKKTLPLWFNPLRTGLMILLSGGLWTAALMVHSGKSGDSFIITGSAGALFGVLYACVTFLQLRFVSKNKTKQDELLLPPNISIPTPEELKYALAGINEKKYFNNSGDDFSDRDSDVQFVPDEDRLNEILDKISESGKDSLTSIEIQYLQDYSNSL